MKENFKMIKEWFKFVKPSKKYFSLEFLLVLFYRITIIISPIFAAKVITCLTVSDFGGAIFNLFLAFAIVALGTIAVHFNYSIYAPKIVGIPYVRLQKTFANNIIKAKKENFKINSKEKLLNIFHSDTFSMAIYADTLSANLAYIIQVLITIVIIFVLNFYIGIALIALLFINGFILNWLYKNYSKKTYNCRTVLDGEYQCFSELCDSHEFASELGIDKKLKKNFEKTSKDYIKAYHKLDLWSSGINNWFSIFYKIGILILTIGLIFFISKGQLSLETYLIVVAYVTSCVELSNTVLKAIPDIKNVSVYMDRVKLLTSLSPKELAIYGSEDNEVVVGNIDLIDVKYTQKEEDKNTSIDINNIRFRDREITLVKGKSGCGKRTIFNLIRRQIVPESGRIIVDGMDISSFSSKAYPHNVNYTTENPFFFSGSILRNFKMMNVKKANISKTCDYLGFLEDINNLPKKFQTPIDSPKISTYLQFMIGVARTVLSGSEIIMIYEIPSTFTKVQKKKIKDMLSLLKKDHTVILFSANIEYVCVCDKIVEMEDGNVSNIQFIPKKK